MQMKTAPTFLQKKAIRIHKNFTDPSKIENSTNKEKDFDSCRDEIKAFTIKFYKKYFD